MRVFSIVHEYTRTPGPRYESEGPFSGAQFRQKFLVGALYKALAAGEILQVDLDGTTGYGVAFLEEVFGGLVRSEGFAEHVLGDVLYLKSDEEPYLIDDIWQYITEAIPTSVLNHGH